jgi:hypothetical protein
MAYGQEERTYKTYFSIRKGRDQQGREKAVFGMKVPKGTPGAVQAFRNDGAPVVDKNGNEVWHAHYDYVSGRITNIEYVEYPRLGNRIDEVMEITIQDESGTAIVTVQKGDRYWVDFAMRAPNIDPSKVVKLKPYSIKDEKTGKINNLLMPVQGGQNVGRHWTKENNWKNDVNGNGGLPPGKKVVNPVDGKDVWTFLDRDRYLNENGIAVLYKNINAANAAVPAPVPTQQPVHQTSTVPANVQQALQTAAAIADDNPFDGAGMEEEDPSDLPF